MTHLLPLLLVLSMRLPAVSGAAPDRLHTGDVAPTLDIAHWMKGEATTTITPGQVFVLEFWATWCGPCVGNMEHLSKTQERYAKEGVTVIGVSDEPLAKTVDFLCSSVGDQGRLQNDRIRYALATDPDRSVHKSYMTAAGRNSLPTVFVIGRTGLVEWIGHPRDMDAVLSAIVDGTWRRTEFETRNQVALGIDQAEREINARFTRAYEAGDWEAVIDAIDELVALGRGELSIPIKYAILLSVIKDGERAAVYARQVRDLAWKDNSWLLYQLAWTSIGTRRHPVAPDLRDLDFALETIIRAVELDPEGSDGHEMKARIHAQRREFQQAAEAQRTAINRLEAVRPNVGKHELKDYAAELDRMREQFREFQAEASGVPSKNQATRESPE